VVTVDRVPAPRDPALRTRQADTLAAEWQRLQRAQDDDEVLLLMGVCDT